MVYNTSEHYNLGQIRAKLLAREGYSVNHVNDIHYKVKTHSGEGKYVSLVIEYSCRLIN